MIEILSHFHIVHYYMKYHNLIFSNALYNKEYTIFFQFQSLMGIFFWIHSVALVEDLSVNEPGEYDSPQVFVTAMEASYNQVQYIIICIIIILVNFN